jgi:hypothetical protein
MLKENFRFDCNSSVLGAFIHSVHGTRDVIAMISQHHSCLVQSISLVSFIRSEIEPFTAEEISLCLR